jgi:hypothetical protein
MDGPDPSGHVPLRTFPRRRFLRDGALATGGAVAGISVPFDATAAGVPSARAGWLRLLAPSSQESLADYTPVALSADELKTLIAAIDRLIPSDDLGPGASEVGVHVYIDRGLAGPNAAILPLYQGGLAALDKAASAGGFAALDVGKQDDILGQYESGDLAGAPEGFFALLLEHTRQGMFADPIYGGNKDFAGWDLIGYPGIKLIWSEADQAIDAVVKPEHKSVAEYGGDAW